MTDDTCLVPLEVTVFVSAKNAFVRRTNLVSGMRFLSLGKGIYVAEVRRIFASWLRPATGLTKRKLEALLERYVVDAQFVLVCLCRGLLLGGEDPALQLILGR